MHDRPLRPLRSALDRLIPSWKLQFGVRLALTVLLTLGIVGVAQYALAARQLTKRVLQQTLAGHQADAAVLNRLYKDAESKPWNEVGALLGHVAQRPGVHKVSIVAPDGTVAAVGKAGHGSSAGGGPKPGMAGMQGMAGMEGMKAPEQSGEEPPLRDQMEPSQAETVRPVLATGSPYAGPHPGAQHGESAYVVPLDFGGKRYVLHIVKDGSLLQQQLADMRWVLVLTLGLALLIGLPLFHVLGGRALNARHRLALRHSSRDGLTGLGNHRSFHEELRSAVELARRHGHRLALALVDLDHFKQVNDTNGHRRGDAVLVEVAQILEQVRTEDRTFRIGGDEFAILFPATNAGGASVVAEKIRAKVEAEMDVVTTSIGIAELGLAAPDADTLLDRADAAMYQAKRQGKNRIVVHDEPQVQQPSTVTIG
jgi:diguanylate cyclase (GGDEF)-like protein